MALDGTTASGGDAAGDTLTNVEQIIATDFDDVLTGNSDNSAERFDGGLGDDLLEGRGGADQFFGGAGSDTVTYSLALSGVTVALDGSAGINSDAQGDTFDSIENLIGSSFNDVLTSGALGNQLEGRSGDDVLTGGIGVDLLYGGDNDDVLAGLVGADELYGGAGTDRADYSASNLAVTINLLTDVNLGGHAAGDTLDSIEDVTGSAFDDSLTGDNEDNELIGGTGNDTLIGGLGADTLTGGDDIDTADYSASSGAVTIDLAGGTGSGGHAQGDVLATIENVIGSNSR